MPQTRAISTYAETPARHVAKHLANAPEGSVPPPQADPVQSAREWAASVARDAGESILLGSLREVGRTPVEVDADGNWREVAATARTGDIIGWTYEVRTPEEGAEAEPVLTVSPHPDGGVVAVLPESVSRLGGAVRVRHALGGEVTVTAVDADGNPVSYLLASPIDDNIILVECYGNTNRLVVTPDSPEGTPKA